MRALFFVFSGFLSGSLLRAASCSLRLGAAGRCFLRLFPVAVSVIQYWRVNAVTYCYNDGIRVPLTRIPTPVTSYYSATVFYCILYRATLRLGESAFIPIPSNSHYRSIIRHQRSCQGARELSPGPAATIVQCCMH